MWHNGGVTTSDWINLIAAILVGGGTLFLGIMALRTIRQNRSIQKAEKRERLLNKIIEWVLDVKISMLQGDDQAIILERKQRYDRIFFAISDVLLNAELMNLRASENSISVEKELNNVWQSAFFCSQLAARIAGKKTTDEQRKRWSKNAIDIVARIDQLEEQGNLTDQEMYNGQKDLLEKISICLKKLVKAEATL